jgi:hypothetical protein
MENSSNFLTGGQSWPVQMDAQEGFGTIILLPSLGELTLDRFWFIS